MRILIGYNGSEASKAALGDYSLMGLPDANDVLIVSVAEAWLPPKTTEEADELGKQAATELSAKFPVLKTKTAVATGSPAHEILAAAGQFEPDMIIVGEPREQADRSNLFLGHTTQKILAGAPCSVRIARAPLDGNPHPERLLVAFDGSAGSISAVNVIADRTWPKETEVRLVAVADSSVLGTIGRFTPQMKDSAVEAKFAAQWAETLAVSSLERLRAADIKATVDVRFGNPKDEIIRAADEWNADTIFAGPHAAANSFERFLIGSVSSAIAARAHCSVEIVRC